jgi:glycosyltransferase involved in cell wall biosynthesis
MEKPGTHKLAFVLPEYGVHTHFRYVGEFAVALADRLDIVLVLEKGDAPKEFPADKVITQRFRNPALRFLEMGWILIGLHFKGYQTHYVHYSFVAGYWSALIVKLFGGRMYYWNCGMPWQYQRGFFREWFERAVFRMVDHLMTGADALHEGYANYYGISRERIVTLPNWIDVAEEKRKNERVDRILTHTRLNIPDGKKVLLFVHRLAKRKGAHLLPAIFERLHSLGCVLLVAGDGPEYASIERDFRERGLSDDVRMLGWVPQEAVHELYAIADLFLLPSEEEGFPHVLTEAQSIGLPYVASDVGGVREMTPPEGQRFLVPFGAVAEFTHVAKVLIEHNDLYHEFARAEKNWVKQYDKHAVLARFLDILSNQE